MTKCQHTSFSTLEGWQTRRPVAVGCAGDASARLVFAQDVAVFPLRPTAGKPFAVAPLHAAIDERDLGAAAAGQGEVDKRRGVDEFFPKGQIDGRQGRRSVVVLAWGTATQVPLNARRKVSPT